ncbi:MAG: LytTR family DNA-binding domain-containing protein [Bacteroidota bacterium]
MPNAPDTVAVLQRGEVPILAGGSIARRERAFPDCIRCLIIPPAAGEQWLYLRSVFLAHKQDSVSIRTELVADEAAMYARRRAFRAEKAGYDYSQRNFIYGLGLFLLLGVFVPALVWGEKIFWAYLWYGLAIFGYYFFRKLESFDISVFYAEIKYGIEGVWTPLIVLTYVNFLRVFLRPVTGWLALLLRSVIGLSGVVIVVVLVTMLIAGVVAGNHLTNVYRLLMLVLSLPMIVLILWRWDIPSRIATLGLVLLIVGLGLIMVNDYYYRPRGIDLEFGYLSFMQYAVVAELLLYWSGVVYRVRQTNRQRTVQAAEILRLRDEQRLLTDKLQEESTELLTLTTSRRTYRWPRPQVQGFVAEREVCRVLFVDKEDVTVPLRLKEVLAQLPADFVRIHRSYVVQLSAVEVFERGKQSKVWLRERTKPIPVGRAGETLLEHSLDNDRIR